MMKKIFRRCRKIIEKSETASATAKKRSAKTAGSPGNSKKSGARGKFLSTGNHNSCEPDIPARKPQQTAILKNFRRLAFSKSFLRARRFEQFDHFLKFIAFLV